MNKTKLLLIDDEKPLLQNLKQILEFQNFEVITAGNGLEGFEQYEKEKPDLVICDIMMPDMDGYGFIKKLRLKGYTDTPFIFLTAKSEYDDLRTGMNIGADDYLLKPIKSSQLLDAINTRLMRKKEINKKVALQLNNISHGFQLVTDKEFFAAINDIIGYLQLLKQKNNQKDERLMEEYIHYIEKSTSRLLNLLNKVKHWQEQECALSDASGSDKSFAPIQKVLTNIAKLTALKYDRAGDLILNVSEDAPLAISEELLETLLTELLDNAFKFSEKGNPVVVGTDREGGQYMILIADCGKITDAASLISFKPFHKNNILPNNDPGIGLGLTIADMIVKRVNGLLVFTNNTPCGILVSVSLPIASLSFSGDLKKVHSHNAHLLV
jgi:DNA-binding response OmpR family regulator